DLFGHAASGVQDEDDVDGPLLWQRALLAQRELDDAVRALQLGARRRTLALTAGREFKLVAGEPLGSREQERPPRRLSREANAAAFAVLDSHGAVGHRFAARVTHDHEAARLERNGVEVHFALLLLQ